MLNLFQHPRHASNVMPNLIQYPPFNQGIPDRVRNDVPLFELSFTVIYSQNIIEFCQSVEPDFEIFVILRTLW